MGKIIRHMSMNIQGLLDNYKGRKINILSDDDGNILSDQAARIHLHDLQILGHKKMCCNSKCEGFDPFEKGCPGHEVKEQRYFEISKITCYPWVNVGNKYPLKSELPIIGGMMLTTENDLPDESGTFFEYSEVKEVTHA